MLIFAHTFSIHTSFQSLFYFPCWILEVADFRQTPWLRLGAFQFRKEQELFNCASLFFFSPLQLFFEDTIDDAKYCGRLYGLGTGVAQKQNEDVDSAQEKMSILAIINNMQPWQVGTPQQDMVTVLAAAVLNYFP